MQKKAEAVSLKGADVDPDIRRFIETMGAAFASYPNFNQLPVAEARQIVEKVRAPWAQGGPQMAETREVMASTREGEVRLRIHRPAGVDPAAGLSPALVYIHGGGWTLFSLDTHDRLMREYAERAGIMVVGVDYALSPEHKFPVALHQIVDVMRWLGREGARFGVDPDRLALGGDSAGGNLTAAAALALRDAGEGQLIKGMVLNYGAFAEGSSEEYHRRYGGEGYMLTSEEMVVFWNNYLGDKKDIQNPLICPLYGDLKGLPPAFMVIPECDVLTEQSLRMAEKLKAAGVPTTDIIYKGATHSFLEAMSISALAVRALDDTAAWLRQLFKRDAKG